MGPPQFRLTHIRIFLVRIQILFLPALWVTHRLGSGKGLDRRMCCLLCLCVLAFLGPYLSLRLWLGSGPSPYSMVYHALRNWQHIFTKISRMWVPNVVVFMGLAVAGFRRCPRELQFSLLLLPVYLAVSSSVGTCGSSPRRCRCTSCSSPCVWWHFSGSPKRWCPRARRATRARVPNAIDIDFLVRPDTVLGLDTALRATRPAHSMAKRRSSRRVRGVSRPSTNGPEARDSTQVTGIGPCPPAIGIALE